MKEMMKPSWHTGRQPGPKRSTSSASGELSTRALCLGNAALEKAHSVVRSFILLSWKPDPVTKLIFQARS